MPTLAQLLKAELAERKVRSVHRTLGCSALPYRIETARFLAYMGFSGVDIDPNEINEANVRQLHRCELFMEGAQIVLLIGPGTRKYACGKDPGHSVHLMRLRSGSGSARPSSQGLPDSQSEWRCPRPA